MGVLIPGFVLVIATVLIVASTVRCEEFKNFLARVKKIH